MSDNLSDSTNQQTAEVDAVNIDWSEIMETDITTEAKIDMSIEEPRKERKSRAILSDGEAAFNRRYSNKMSTRRSRAKKIQKADVAAAIGICDTSSMTLRTTTVKKSRTDTLEKKETSLQTNFKTLQTELHDLIKLGNNDRKEKIKKKFKWKQVYGQSYPITLQFNTVDNKWLDWLEVKRSGYKDAGNGLFACVDIPVNKYITVYMGNEKDEVNENRNYMFKTNWKFKKDPSGNLKWDNTRKSTSKKKR